METVKSDYLIDIRSVIEKKFGKGKVPGFVIWLVKKLIHEDFLNSYFVKEYDGMEFCHNLIPFLNVKIDVKGLENLPSPDGRYVFASNHPLGGLEAVVETAVIGDHYDGKIRHLANDFLMAVKGLRPFFVPINKTGSQARSLPMAIAAAFESDDQIIIYPAGQVSRKGRNGVIEDRPWAKTFIQKSVQTQRDVVPVRFVGRNSWRFYAMDKVDSILRKFGVKFPICMALLPDEVYRTQGKSYTMIIGKPIPYTTFTAEKSASDWAQWVRSKVYELN